MLTSGETKLINWIRRTGSKSFSIPFTWKDDGLVEKSQSNTKCHVIAWLLMILKLIAKLRQLNVISTSAVGNVNQYFLHAFLTLIPLAHIICKLNICLYKTEMLRLISESTRSNSNWGQTFLGQKFIAKPIREKAFLLMNCAAVGALFLMLLMEILARNEAGSFYGLIQNDFHWTTSLLAFSVYASVETFLVADYALHAVFTISTIYSCYFTMMFWIQKICVEWLKSKNQPEIYWDTRSISVTCILHFRGINILNNDCNTAFGKLFIPFIKIVLMVAFIMSFVAYVKLFRVLDPLSVGLMAVVLFAALILLIPITVVMSNLFDMSAEFPRNLQQRADMISDEKLRKWLDCELKSCAVIRCQVGGLYYMESKAKLTMISHIINGVVSLLVNLNTA